jgi:GNAT superfamily N-acetyltransferase
MHSRQGTPQGRLGSGGAPASAQSSPAPSSDALGSATHPGVEITLPDGLTVLLRSVRAEDAAAVRCLFQGLSERSTWLRFFTVCPRLDRVVGWASEDDNDRLGLVAIAGGTGQLIAHAGLERDHRQPDRAEFALVVADRYQGRGLGRVLLGRLVEAAQRVGIQWLTAEVLAENHGCSTCFVAPNTQSACASAMGWCWQSCRPRPPAPAWSQPPEQRGRRSAGSQP